MLAIAPLLYLAGLIPLGVMLMGDPLCPPDDCAELHARMELQDRIVMIGGLLLPAVIWAVTVAVAVPLHVTRRRGAWVAGVGMALGCVVWIVAFVLRLTVS